MLVRGSWLSNCPALLVSDFIWVFFFISSAGGNVMCVVLMVTHQ